MKQVAKVVIIDKEQSYLLMYRNGHPRFGDDADIPGGIIEADELPEVAMVREAYEEAGIDVSRAEIKQLYEGYEYSSSGTHYSLYLVHIDDRPAVTMSWEHSKYEWLDREEFLEKAKDAKDSYMHMVYDVLK